MPRGDRATAKLHRDWLRALPQLTGKPLTRIARETQIAPSTLTRPLKDGDDGTSTLHANTIAKVVETTGVAPPNDLGALRPGQWAARELQDVAPYIARPNDPLAPAIGLLCEPPCSAWILRTRVLELAGFVPGDILFLDQAATPQPGQVVLAELHHRLRQAPILVARVLERAAPLQVLMARTLDPELQQPWVVDDRVVLRGVFLPHRLRAAA